MKRVEQPWMVARGARLWWLCCRAEPEMSATLAAGDMKDHPETSQEADKEPGRGDDSERQHQERDHKFKDHHHVLPSFVGLSYKEYIGIR